jgi:hypothetical protein
MFAIRKGTTAIKRSAPRQVVKRGYWVLRTLDPSDPFGPAMDPETGAKYSTLDDVVPAGWEEAFRDEYLPGVQRARGYKAWVSAFPHEVVLVDPARYTVTMVGKSAPQKAVTAKTCIPTWIHPITK